MRLQKPSNNQRNLNINYISNFLGKTLILWYVYKEGPYLLELHTEVFIDDMIAYIGFTINAEWEGKGMMKQVGHALIIFEAE